MIPWNYLHRLSTKSIAWLLLMGFPVCRGVSQTNVVSLWGKDSLLCPVVFLISSWLNDWLSGYAWKHPPNRKIMMWNTKPNPLSFITKDSNWQVMQPVNDSSYLCLCAQYNTKFNMSCGAIKIIHERQSRKEWFTTPWKAYWLESLKFLVFQCHSNWGSTSQHFVRSLKLFSEARSGV